MKFDSREAIDEYAKRLQEEWLKNHPSLNAVKDFQSEKDQDEEEI